MCSYAGQMFTSTDIRIKLMVHCSGFVVACYTVGLKIKLIVLTVVFIMQALKDHCNYGWSMLSDSIFHPYFFPNEITRKPI